MQHDEYRQPPVHYWESGWFSYLTFRWVNSLVETGIQRQVTLDDIPELAPREDALVTTRALLENLDESERARKSHPLLRAIWYSFWPQFLVLQSLRVAAHLLGLLDPMLMYRVLVFQERQNAAKTMTAEEVRTGFMSVSALIFLGFFMLFFSTQMQFYQNRLLIRIGSALRGAVLYRCIQGQRGVGNSSISGPSAYNVISFDIDPVVDIIWIALAVWLFPFQFISTLAVLWYHVGWAVVPGLITIIIAKLIVGVLLYRDGLLRDILLTAKDRRLRDCNEGFNHIRTLHMLAWREPFQEQIMRSRVHELHAQKMRLWMSKMAAALDYSLAMIVTFVTLGYFVFSMKQELKASVALPVIQLIVNLMGPIGQFPVWMNQYLVWKSAYARLSAFIGLDNNPNPEELPEQFLDSSGGGPPPDFRNKVAAMKDCTLSWGSPSKVEGGSIEEGLQQPLLEKSVFELQNLNLGVNGGDLLVVAGLEGQGKSSMLLGLLGEMTIRTGKAHSPAITRLTASSAGGASLPGLPESMKAARLRWGSASKEEEGLLDTRVNPLAVPFSAQTAMLFSGSIRWNILFGSPHYPSVYAQVLHACALEEDVATMPAGDLTEVAQGGATLSGGQKRRISIARTVYRAAIALQQQPTVTPLVLLDDPVCGLDKQVAQEVCEGLFGKEGLLTACAVVVASADPWWVCCLPPAGAAVSPQGGVQVALVRGGRIIDVGALSEMKGKGFTELDSIVAMPGSETSEGNRHQGLPAQPTGIVHSNPQGDDDDEVSPEANQNETSVPSADVKIAKRADSQTQTELTAAQKEALHVVKEEERDEGHVKWSTYQAYIDAVGKWTILCCVIALTGIMVFQNFCNLWIAYWTAEDKEKSFVYTTLQTLGVEAPTDPHAMLWIFGGLVVLFTLSNFAGHSFEIIGGVAAAGTLFRQALEATFHQPFRWWDANPTGRVLNGFSEDVMVMDAAITNIMGVIFGAVLYFFGHSIILAITNPWSLLLLPFIAAGLEYYAQYYRKTIREIQRIFRVRMGLLYQDITEAIVGRVTVRSFAQENQVMESSLESLDRYQQANFGKMTLALWLGLRMACIGYILSFWVKLRPILQYYGYVGEQSAALVGLSIMYSTETVGIIQQFITNYSELEMQLISIERLSAIAAQEEIRRRSEALQISSSSSGLQLRNVTVTYRAGLLPALVDLTIGFPAGEISAIVGRTGAGKSSLLLSILQLVPYDGSISVCGEALHDLAPEDARSRLVGIVPQQPVLFEGDLRWNLDPENERSDDELWTALAAVGLEGKAREAGGFRAKVSGSTGDSQSAQDDESVQTLEFSAGQQQMLCAARVLLRRPRVAMLDEVAASLPTEAARSMVSTLVGRFKQDNSTVLLVTHQDDLLDLCDRVVRINAGRIVDDRRR